MLAVLVACTSPAPICPSGGYDTLAVTVTDALSGLDVCGASVVASEGTSMYRLREIAGASDASCRYYFYIKGAGTQTYTVSVTAPGYKPGQASNVTVAFDGCGHVQNTQGVAIKLVPAP